MSGKKILAVLLSMMLLLSMAFCLASCKDETPEEPKDGETEQKELGMYTVKYKDTVIELGKDATAVLKALGEPTAKQFVASCGEGAGDQWRYTYSSIYLFTVKDGEAETVDAIALRDDIAETGKGIAVGSTEDEIKAAYGEPTATQGNKLRYTDGNKTLEFQLSDAGTVTSVELRVES